MVPFAGSSLGLPFVCTVIEIAAGCQSFGLCGPNRNPEPQPLNQASHQKAKHGKRHQELE